MTRITKMKMAKKLNSASKFVSTDLLESASFNSTAATAASVNIIISRDSNESVTTISQSPNDDNSHSLDNDTNPIGSKKRRRHRDKNIIPANHQENNIGHLGEIQNIGNKNDKKLQDEKENNQQPDSQSTIKLTKKQKQKQRLEAQALHRRNRRLIRKERKMNCFNCRENGHSIKTCPKLTCQVLMGIDHLVDGDASGGILCYKCGSLEHIMSKCTDKSVKANSLLFATCFVCKQKGHLAGACPENEKGVYPNGGCCKYCGSVRHLSFDCKPVDPGGDQVIALGKMVFDQGADDDDQFVALHNMSKDATKKNLQPAVKKVKVVKF